jgi:hypothetical protein
MRLRLTRFLDKLRRRPPAPDPAGAAAGTGTDATLREVRFAYEPSLDGDPDPGEVVWAWVPYEEDPRQGKDRPVVIVGRVGASLAGVALTTKGRHHEDNVFVGTGAWDPERRDSFAKLDRLLRIDPKRVRREGAVLDKDRFEDLVRALQRHG